MIEMIWFDAKSEKGSLADFLLEYWPLLKSDGGLLLVHFTAGYDTSTHQWWLIDIKGLIVSLGLANEAELESIQLIEPHKYRQGAVTMIRRAGQGNTKYVKMMDHPTVRPNFYKDGVTPPPIP